MSEIRGDGGVNAEADVMVNSVCGPIAARTLGVTLTHEHLINDVRSWAHRSQSRGWNPQELQELPVAEDILWDLRMDPFSNLDNCRLDDVAVAISEVQRFADLGGVTIVEATGLGIGRDLARLRDISVASGVQIVAGTGYYLHSSMPEPVQAWTSDQFTERILADLRDGEDGIRPGIIGEIGVGEGFTDAEQRSLRGALAAQRETGIPIQIHLPGWLRVGERVMDLVDAAGVDSGAVVLCHMGPSGDDLDYQRRLLDRGAWVQYDMIGMDVYYADQHAQCPNDEQNAAWLARLIDLGYLDQLLISQDIFLKSLLRTHGGPGYSHILQYFVPRLHQHGVDETHTHRLIHDNPRRLFERSAR